MQLKPHSSLAQGYEGSVQMSRHGKNKLINLKCFELSLVKGCGSLKEEGKKAVVTTYVGIS